MTKFRSIDGTLWTITLDGPALERIESVTGTPDLLYVLETVDPSMLLNMIYQAVKPQADGRGLDIIAFGRAINTPELNSHAADALVGGVIALMNQPDRRTARGAWQDVRATVQDA